MARWRWHAGAALLYAAFSWIMLDHGASLTRNYLGEGPDPGLIMWFLAWWPWAAAHHLHSLQTMLLWRPNGLNLAWTTSVPLLALLALPATLLSGPVLAFNLLALATTLGLDPHVRFLGHLSEDCFSAVWSKAGALVFPSLHEGFGIPLVEAMAFGLPVLCSRAGALPEVG